MRSGRDCAGANTLLVLSANCWLLRSLTGSDASRFFWSGIFASVPRLEGRLQLSVIYGLYYVTITPDSSEHQNLQHVNME